MEHLFTVILNLIGAVVRKFFELIAMPHIAKKIRKKLSVVPQKVRWHLADSKYGTGLLVWTDDSGTVERDIAWISWTKLKPEIERNLLPLVFNDPAGYVVAARDFLRKRDHTVQVIDSNGIAVLYLWFGSDPNDDWKNEAGLVHIGGGTVAPIAWQTYRRLSDGTYERIRSIYRNYENTPLEKRQNAIEEIGNDNDRTATLRNG